MMQHINAENELFKLSSAERFAKLVEVKGHNTSGSEGYGVNWRSTD